MAKSPIEGAANPSVTTKAPGRGASKAAAGNALAGGESIPAALAAMPTTQPEAASPAQSPIDPPVQTPAESPPIEPASPASEPVAKKPAPAHALAPEPVATPPAAVPADTAAKEADAMATNFDQAAENTAAKGQAMFADLNDRTKSAMEKGARAFEDMTAFGKGNVEAIVESSKIAAKGLETIGQNTADFTRRSFESASAAFRSFASVKSPAEFLSLHNEYVRSAFDTMVAETSRSTETMLKIAGEVAQPLSNRVALAADKVKAGG